MPRRGPEDAKVITIYPEPRVRAKIEATCSALGMKHSAFAIEAMLHYIGYLERMNADVIGVTTTDPNQKTIRRP